jgi:hypothetical protein
MKKTLWEDRSGTPAPQFMDRIQALSKGDCVVHLQQVAVSIESK